MQVLQEGHAPLAARACTETLAQLAGHLRLGSHQVVAQLAQAHAKAEADMVVRIQSGERVGALGSDGAGGGGGDDGGVAGAPAGGAGGGAAGEDPGDPGAGAEFAGADFRAPRRSACTRLVTEMRKPYSRNGPMNGGRSNGPTSKRVGLMTICGT